MRATGSTRPNNHPFEHAAHGNAAASRLRLPCETCRAEERDRIDTTHMVDLVFGAWARKPSGDALP